MMPRQPIRIDDRRAVITSRGRVPPATPFEEQTHHATTRFHYRLHRRLRPRSELAGCATTTSGPTVNAGPVLSKIVGTNVLMNDPGVLTLYATQACNVSAAQEYRLSIEACTGQFAGLAGGAMIPANVISGINLLCQTLGYTGANNQLLVPSAITWRAIACPPRWPAPASVKAFQLIPWFDRC